MIVGQIGRVLPIDEEATEQFRQLTKIWLNR